MVFYGQGLSNFEPEIEEVMITGMPSLQSFAWAKTNDGKWLLVAGRTDGMHDHRPPFSFPANMANSNIWVVDPVNKQVWSKPITSLNTDLRNALTATNINFQQVDDVLYLVGGYGVNLSNNQHQTFSYLTAIDVTNLANAIIANQIITPYFKQLSDSRLQVTGGYLHALNNLLVLIGGQNFDGRYNPHDGPSFTQTYSESIKRFQVIQSGMTIQLVNYSETVDAANLHRRDYNAVMQIFPNGDTGITAFSGVFRPNIDLPFFNTVDVRANSYSVRNTFNQFLNQYHTANMPLYDVQNNTMHTVFFGGIGMYYPDALGNILVDSLVPFVKTISRVSRFFNDSMAEFIEPIEMPGYLGAGAEFITSDSVQLLADEIIDLNSANGRTLAGYIVGGINSNAQNIFMMGGTSQASSKVFKVYLKPASIGIDESAISLPFSYSIYPNPVKDILVIDIIGKNVVVEIINANGVKLYATVIKQNEETLRIDMESFAAGIYFVNFRHKDYKKTEKIVKK